MKKLLILLFILVFCFILYIVFVAESFLSFQKPVESNNILIESWISAYEIEKAAELFLIDSTLQYIVIGQNLDDKQKTIKESDIIANSNVRNKIQNKGTWLLTNSTLEFNLQNFHDSLFEDSIDITLTIRGTQAEKHYAHFNLIINGFLAGSSFSTEDYQRYEYKYFAGKNRFSSFCIRFDNDLYTETSDRNLNVHSLTINGLNVIADNNTTTITRCQDKSTSGFISKAEEVANYINDLGIIEEKIHTLNFDSYRRNKTLLAAKSVKQWSSDSLLKSVNIITSGIHSRRTWLTYKRLLEPDTKVGTIYFPTKDYKKKTTYKNVNAYIDIIDEYFSYVFNWFELTF
ncbi:MAG: hypothetical protein K8R68_05415 [Bacteroidales bacterium]|nr:hypothetical protein [Bacteroidales bacterium]